MKPSHVLTFDTVRPGCMPQMLDAAQREAREPPGGRTLLGAWQTEFATLNQLVRLWHTAAGGAGCAALERPDDLQERSERLLAEQLPTARGEAGPWYYELRMYRLERGRIDEFLGLLLSHMQLRETWSKPIGLWKPLDGDLDEVVHLWYYRDLQHRAATRAAAAAHPVWDAYRRKVLPMLAAQHSLLLSPVAFSPLR